MAVAIEMNFKGATIDQYDQVIEKMGLTGGSRPSSRRDLDWVAKTDEGIRVVDVWETKKNVFDRFAADQDGPLHPRAGIDEEPEMRIYDVHNHLTPS